MGGCISACSHKNRVTQVLALSSSDVATNGSEERPLSEGSSVAASSRRRFRLKNLGKLLGKSSNDGKKRWAFRSKPRVIVSPMPNDVEAMTSNAIPASKEKPNFTLENENIEEARKRLFAVKAVPVVPKQTVNADKRTLRLLRNTERDEIEIVDFGSEDETGTSEDLSDLSTTTSDGSLDDDDDEQSASRPMTARPERLDGKLARETAAVENIKDGDEAEVTKSEVVQDNVQIVQDGPHGPKIIMITVRPKSPDRIKVVPKPKPSAGPKPLIPAPLNKVKEQMIPRLSEMLPLDYDDDDDLCEIEFPLKCSLKFAEETDSETNSDSDDVISPAPGLAGEVSAPAREPPEDSSTSGGETSNKPVKVKKKRPVKVYPYRRGRFIPQPPNPEEYWCLAPEPVVVRKRQRNTKNYEEFSNRLLRPSEKARATEGQIIDGTLITWPKYLKQRGQSEQDGRQSNVTTGPRRAKMAWGGETTQENRQAAVLRASSQFLANGTRRLTNHHSVNTSHWAAPKIKESRHEPVNSVTSKRYAYKPQALFQRRNDVPFFKEKKLSYNPPTPPECSAEEQEFSFTREDLRRYANKRRAQLQRRPKTPLHGKIDKASKVPESRAEHQAAPSTEPKPGLNTAPKPGVNAAPMPGASTEQKLGASTELKPGASNEPKPGMTTEPKPGVSAEPKLVVSAEPKPGASTEPKRGVIAEPKPGTNTEPKPGVSAEPKPGASAEPKPGVSTEPKPGVSAEPKPGASTEPKPGASTEPKPGASTESKPGASTEPKPGASAEPMAEDEPEPLVYSFDPDGSIHRCDPKSITFEIPLEGKKVRPPISRPNTRRQMRPNTPRADIGELALRQANAQKRREDVIRSRARGLSKRDQDPGAFRKTVKLVKAQELMDKVDEKMNKYSDNREKQLEGIVAKQQGHDERMQKQKDQIFNRKQFLGETEPEASSVTNPSYTISDLVEVNRVFDEMDKKE